LIYRFWQHHRISFAVGGHDDPAIRARREILTAGCATFRHETIGNYSGLSRAQTLPSALFSTSKLPRRSERKLAEVLESRRIERAIGGGRASVTQHKHRAFARPHLRQQLKLTRRPKAGVSL
jgi:hypothetical protein